MENRESATKCVSTVKKDEVIETGEVAESDGSTKGAERSVLSFIYFLRLSFF